MDPSSLHPSVNQAATLSFSFGGVGHLERIPVPRSSSLGQLGGLFGDGQSAPLHCRSENHWGDGQVHTSRVPHRRPGFVHWHWALSASNFHRGLNWKRSPSEYQGKVPQQSMNSHRALVKLDLRGSGLVARTAPPLQQTQCLLMKLSCVNFSSSLRFSTS